MGLGSWFDDDSGADADDDNDDSHAEGGARH